MSEVHDQDPGEIVGGGSLKGAGEPSATEPQADPQVTGNVVALTREVILPAPDRSRVAAVAAMCSLAGIAVGFGLSMFALQMTEAAGSAARLRPPRALAVHGCPRRAVPRLGIEFDYAHTSVGIHYDVGVVINRVFAPPARNAGLRPGDIVVGYDGQLVDDTHDMVQLVAHDRVGGHPRIDVLRSGELIRVVPTLDAWP